MAKIAFVGAGGQPPGNPAHNPHGHWQGGAAVVALPARARGGAAAVVRLCMAAAEQEQAIGDVGSPHMKRRMESRCDWVHI